MADADKLPVRVEIKLLEGTRLLDELIAETEGDLYCRVQMVTGIGWIDTMDQYQTLVERNREKVNKRYFACHSYEKWGDLQQERMLVSVRMRRLASEEPMSEVENSERAVATANIAAMKQRFVARGHLRDELHGFDSGYINQALKIYWLGMIGSALWIGVYFLR